MAPPLISTGDSCRRAGLLLGGPPARAQGLKFRPAHPRRSAEELAWYRRFATLSRFCQTHPLQRLRRHYANVCLGGEAGENPAGFKTILPLSVSQDGAELLVKDNQGADYRGA